MVRKILNLTTLENKEELSLNIISEILLKAKNPYMLFTGEKDSLVMLHLISQLQHGSINLPVLHIDTTVEFSEIYKFIDKICKLWGIRLIRERNEVASRTIEIAEDKELCCRLLKTEALDKAIYKYGIDYLFLAKRVDEQREDPFFAAQGKCAFVNPLSHFSEQDAWDYPIVLSTRNIKTLFVIIAGQFSHHLLLTREKI